MTEITALIQDLTGATGIKVKRLDGYDNANYRVDTEQGRLIFKTYPYDQKMLDLVRAENEVLLQLFPIMSDSIPKPILLTGGEYCVVSDIGEKKYICRALSYLEGRFMGDSDYDEALLTSLGDFLARLDKAMLALPANYVYQSRRWAWDIQYLSLNRSLISAITTAQDRSLVEYFFQQFEEIVIPALPKLRRSLIHNDANEWNILLDRENAIAGLIDFGDLAYSPLINELAIAITYACYDKEDPLSWSIHLLSAYHKRLPLKELEIELLYYLIAARLCISVCNSAHARSVSPDNAYLSVSEKPAWTMLRRWLAIGPIAAKHAFRSSVGLPVASYEQVSTIVERRYRSTSKTLSISYKNPIYLERAAFQYMYDVQGNSFLDAYNNIPHVGHSHPRVVAAGQRQMAKLNTNTRYLYDLLPVYAEQLLAHFPQPLNKVFFVNSGSAASDLAIRMARAHTGEKRIMVMEHGYHGNTQIGIDISDYKFSQSNGQGKVSEIIKTNIPDTYRGVHTNDDGSAGAAYAREAIAQLENGGRKIAAFISEPVVGCGGQVPLAKGYLQELYPAIRRMGGLCISDEVQTGFGRLGDHFWGFEAHGVVPDMVILGKPMGNGHPIGAVVCTSAIADSFANGVEFFSSFGGNPVSCAIGLEVLNVIEDENLQANAKLVGDYYQSLLQDLKKKHPCIGDIRGSGLFLGIEFVKDNTLLPDRELAQHIKNELRERFILASTDGPYNSVIKSKPPLVFTKENAEQVVENIQKIITTAGR